MMRVRASLPSYKEIEVELNSGKTVGELKQLLCSRLGIEPELTKLLLHNEALSEKSRISKLKEIDTPLVIDYLWARHLILWGPEGQRRIRSSSVLIAGAGAIGNEVAKNLAMLGVGRLFIVDRDRVEMSNVSRMIFFEPNDLGMNKAEVLAKNIHRKFRFVETMAFRGELENLPHKFYLDSDVLICGLDNVASRIFLTQLCRKYDIPMVDGGITGLNARVHIFIPPDDACPICIFPQSQYSQIIGLRNPCDAPVEQEAVPSFATSISLVSSILSQEAIKLILGLKEQRRRARWPENVGQPLKSVLFIDLKNNRYSPMDLKRNERCLVCGRQGTARELVPRLELPIKNVRDSRRDVEKVIRIAVNAENRSLTVFSETSRGTRRLDLSRLMESLERGDYLRILAEDKNGELHESIVKLT